MPEIPADIHRQLAALGIRDAQSVRWIKHAPLTAKVVGQFWIGCKCTAGKQVKMRYVEIHRRTLGLGQCSNCKAVHWRDWIVVADVAKGGWASIIDVIEQGG
jgi:hypothetical protein